MHEQQNRSVMFEQLLFEPVLPPSAIVTGIGPGLGRIEKQAAAGSGVVEPLREAVGLGIFRTYAQERRAIIVIANAEPNGKRETVQSASQPFIVG